MLTPARLESYMRNAAALGREVVETPPFLCLFSPHDPLRFFNYAKPLEPVGSDPDGLGVSLASLRAAFRARERMPRFEFIEEFAPHLGPALEAAGFSLEARYPLLVCTPETLRPVQSISGLVITMLTADSPVEDLLGCLSVQQASFGEIAGNPPTLGDVDVLRENLTRDAAFLARLGGVPVGAGMYTAPLDGLAELVGIATLEAYRRRGIGAAITAAATAHAFLHGVDAALLTAADVHAGRVYERAGFWRYGTGLAYVDER